MQTPGKCKRLVIGIRIAVALPINRTSLLLDALQGDVRSLRDGEEADSIEMKSASHSMS